MRPTFLISSALFCLTALAAHADPTSDARKAIQAACNRENAAAARLDAAGVLSFKTADYVSINTAGKTTTLEESRPAYIKMFAGAKSAKAVTQVQSVVFKDGGAVVIARENGTIVVTNPQTGKLAAIASDDIERSFWVKTKTGWKCKITRVIKERTTIDGHLMPQQ